MRVRAHNLWDVIDSAVVQCGFTSLRSKFHLPLGLLYPIAYLGEAFTALTGRFVKLTPFTIRMLGAQSPLIWPLWLSCASAPCFCPPCPPRTSLPLCSCAAPLPAPVATPTAPSTAPA